MTILVLEENQITENDQEIPDLSAFLKRLSSKTEITLILKTHDALYHLCPIRKAVPFLKSAEYSSEYWVGENPLSKGQTFIAGILPTPFMQTMVAIISELSFPVKGAFLWTDLILQAYGPFDPGWTLIWHNYHLLICQDGILKISRSCYQSFEQELPAILRYLKRFGYEEGMPITLFKSSLFPEPLPPFIHSEIRIPKDLSHEGLSLYIPELTSVRRLYTWPRKIHTIAITIAFLNILGISYFGSQIKSASNREHFLKQEINTLPNMDPPHDSKMAAFAAYRRLAKNRPDLLSLLRKLTPLLRDGAVATNLHWIDSPLSLTLHLELQSTTEIDQLLLTLRSQLKEYNLTWKAAEEEPLKGILILEKQTLQEEES